MTRLQHTTSLMASAHANLDKIGYLRRVALAKHDTVGVIMLDVLAAQQQDILGLLGARLTQFGAANDATTLPGAA
jgi:hypothetical protein